MALALFIAAILGIVAAGFLLGLAWELLKLFARILHA